MTFDPEAITYKDLLKQFWFNIDPFDDKGQFCDRGDSYKPVIFTSNITSVKNCQIMTDSMLINTC